MILLSIIDLTLKKKYISPSLGVHIQFIWIYLMIYKPFIYVFERSYENNLTMSISCF